MFVTCKTASVGATMRATITSAEIIMQGYELASQIVIECELKYKKTNINGLTQKLVEPTMTLVAGN